MASNWVMGEVSRRLNNEERDIADVPVSALRLAMMIKAIADGEISNNAGKLVLEALWQESQVVVGAVPEDVTSAALLVHKIIGDRGLKQVSDLGVIEKIIDEVMAANAEMVAQFRAGKEKAFNALVGQAMKASKGKANPQQVNDLLRQKLG